MTSLAQESNLELEVPDNLELPKPKIIDYYGHQVIGFTPDDYKIILQLYSGYILYQDLKIEYGELEYHFQNELEICDARLEAKEEALIALSEDRKFVYETTEKYMEEYDKQQKKNKIRTILISTGSGLAGIGIGIITGLIIARTQ